jgi:FlaA1/EpsC-like NDP-sugar epimerase
MTIPGMADLVAGNTSLEQIKEVGVEDLLGRDPVEPNTELMSANIRNKVVLVSGAGGSIGSELCRQIIKQSPTKLVLFELTEFALYSIEKELNEFIKSKGLDIELIPIMGSV